MTNWDNSYVEWYEFRKEDYQQVKERLAACRNVLLYGSEEAAIELLQKSVVNAVLSIQTSRERHERAFTMHYAGDTSLKTACKETVYGNQKYDWLIYTLGNYQWAEKLQHIRGQIHAGNPVAAVKHMTDCKGLSWVKGAFALAMCGVTEVACPDSRTSQELGIEGKIRSEKAYRDALQAIDDSVPIDEPLFIKQWVVYSYFEQQHVTHEPYFTEALKYGDRDNQL
jgi:hypothetical protein